MDDRTLILLFTCFVPLFTAVVGTIIEAISLQDSVTVREKYVKRMLMCYFLMFIFIGAGVATGVALPKIAMQILPLTVFSLYIAPVLYYRFVYLLTNTENNTPLISADITCFRSCPLLVFVPSITLSRLPSACNSR